MRDIKPVIGYVHTGIEKNCEDKSYWKVIPLVERMDYLSYYFNAMAYCGSVETLLDIEVPKRAQYLRVDPHGAQPDRVAPAVARDRRPGPRRDVGLLVRLARPRPDPRPVRDVLRPAHAPALLPGRRRRRGHPGRLGRSKARAFTKQFPKRIDQFEHADRQEPDRARAPARRRRRRRRHAARPTASPARCCAPPATRGTCARPQPYSSYEDFDFKIPVGTVGDNYDRYRVRMAEMRESALIIDQALDGLPEGDYITSDRKYALPPRHELATSMEALIHHFKLVTEGFRVPPGEAYYPIESPRGELGCFVRSDGSSKPARVHMRDPSFVNLQALQADGAGPLHRRPDRRAGDARPDPRRDRPLMAIDPITGQALRARLARPGLGRLRRPDEGPGGRPRPRDDVRARARARRRSRTLMTQVPGHPLGRRSRR